LSRSAIPLDPAGSALVGLVVAQMCHGSSTPNRSRGGDHPASLFSNPGGALNVPHPCRSPPHWKRPARLGRARTLRVSSATKI